MENGDSLNYGTNTFSGQYNNGYYNSIQGALILPIPESKDLYHIFHIPVQTVVESGSYYQIGAYLYYSTVDMSKNGGLGKVIRKNQIIVNDSIGSSNITACRHANGRDWWILVKESFHHRFYRVLLTPDGLTVKTPVDFGGNRMDVAGQSHFAPDGKSFIQGGLEGWAMQSPFHLHKYDFDRCTGMLSNYWHEQDNEPYLYTGCAISPNSRYLYYSSQANKVYQLDLQAVNIMDSRIQVAEIDTNYNDPPAGIFGGAGFSAMQLGPDDKIYINAPNVRCLHVIDQPDSAGIACNVIRQGLSLPSINSIFCIPNFPYFRLGAEPGTICDSLTTVSIAPESTDILARVYPNPACSAINIALNTKDNAQFYLQDIQGKEILQASVREKQQISVAHLPEGLYIYKIEMKNRNEYGKIWIVR